MEKYLNELSPEQADELFRQAINSVSCVRAVYDVDALLFSFVLAIEAKRQTVISFGEGEGCELILTENREGRKLTLNKQDYFLGKSAFSSLVRPDERTHLAALLGVHAASLFDRRQFTHLEEARLNGVASTWGAIVEEGPKLPNYKNLPLFTSLTFSFDPYFPGISGIRSGAEAVLKELKIDLTAALENLTEGQKNSLFYRLVLTAQKHNPNFSNLDLFGKRVFVKDVDLLELAFASMYVLDVSGSGYLYQLVEDGSFAEVITSVFREEMAKGFKIEEITERSDAIVVKTNLRSPLLVRQILAQAGKVKMDKTVAVSLEGVTYTSRAFVNSPSEGLIKI